MTIVLKVEGMTCQHCVRAVTAAIQALDPAAQVAVDLPGHSITAQTTLAQPALAAALAEEGYRVVG